MQNSAKTKKYFNYFRKSSLNVRKELEQQNTYKGISVIAYNTSIDKLQNILDNFIRQKYPNKELIIVINNNELDLKRLTDELICHKDIKVLESDVQKTMGGCLRYGIEESNKDFIAIFSEDHYYGADYLENCVYCITSMNVDVIGKSIVYIYFKDINLLGVLKKYACSGWIDSVENDYTSYVREGTLFVKRHVFNKIKFANKDSFLDLDFCKKCKDNQIRIYASNRNDYVYILQDLEYDAYNFSKKDLIDLCSIIIQTNDFSCI